MVDKLGSELAKGDKVTLTGEIVAIGENGKVVVKLDEDEGSAPLVQTKPTNVTKQGDNDTLKAAQRGFNDRNG